MVALAFLALTLVVYWPALNGGLIWDDDAHLTKLELRSLGGLGRIWFEPGATQQYYPIVHSIFWLEGKLWGTAVLPYHLVNVFLHAMSATLLVAILRKLKIPGALLAGAIFALHPVHVESVAWISELKNTLSGFLCLSAILFYLHFDDRRDRKSYWIALVLFAVGLMSKSVIATTPAALLVIFWWKRGRISFERDVFPLLPFFVVGISAGLFTAWMEHNYIGARGQAFDYSLGERILIAGRAFWFYLSKLFWPARLIFIYPRWQISGAIWWQYLFPVGAGAVLGIAWLLRKRSRSPLAALLIFGGTIFPVLGFVNVYPFIFSFVADHFQYLASISIIALTAAGLTLVLKRFQFAVLLVVGPLACLTWQQARMYRDAETLYSVTLQRNPDCWMAHNNLSTILCAKGDIDGAITHSEKALALKPDNYQPHASLGDALVLKHQFDEAVAHFEQALKLKPAYVEGHTRLGNVYLAQKKPAEAMAEFEKTLALAPNSLGANEGLAWLLATCRDVSLRNGTRAVQLAEKASTLPGGDNPRVVRTLAAAYAQSGQIPRAVETAERAIKLAGNDRAVVSALQKDLEMYRSHLP